MQTLNLASLQSSERRELLALLEERQRRKLLRRIEDYYPDTGALRRELYPKHLAFFRRGAEYRERLFLAANRVGKTEGAGGYEVARHLMGNYPSWWQGRRFSQPVNIWAAGKTNQTTRDIIQSTLFGNVSHAEAGRRALSGTGLVHGDKIGAMTWRQGVPDMLDTIKVKHVSGGWSELGLKSYEQGRGSFEGTAKHVIWLDEEPPMDIYLECLIRTMTTGGIVMLTFTPLEGMSEVVLSFLQGGRLPEDA